MGLFKSSKNSTPPTPPAPEPTLPGQPVRKDRPTPSRREAEAARMARLHPELDPKKAKLINREAEGKQRRAQLAAVDNLPERALMRDVVDSRFNVGEFALPVMLLVLLLVMIPQLQFQVLAEASVYFMWAIVLLLVGDLALLWRTFKRLAAQRIPDRPLKGLMFYGWNRQMSFRRWRIPAPRVKRGEAI